MADKKKRTFVPNLEASNLSYSLPVIRQEVTLHSNDAQSLLLHFRLVAMALYKLGITMRRMTAEDKVDELQRIVYQEILAPLEENLNTESAKVSLAYQSAGIQPAVLFTQPIKIAVDLSYPGARRFLDLLVGLDNMLRRLADLWFAEKINDIEYKKVQTECRNSLKEAGIRINRLVRQAMRLIESKEPDQNSGAEIATIIEAEESPPKVASRRRRQAAAIAPPSETPESEHPKELESGTSEDNNVTTFSPFEQIQ